MTEKVIFKSGDECVLQIKGEHIELGSLHGQLHDEFVSFCEKHSYHPTTASIVVTKKEKEFGLKMHMHINQKDLHSHAENEDYHKAIKDAFHTLYSNTEKIKR